MTPYEKLSLALLACIANGIGLHLLGEMITTPEDREKHSKSVLAWQESLIDLVAQAEREAVQS